MSSSLSRISLESRMREDKSTTTRWLYTFQNSSTWKRNPSRDLHNEGRISISYTKVYPFRFIGGEGDFVREEEQNSARILIGTLETSGNSPGIDRIGSLYSNYGGRGKEADRSGHVRISPRNCFRGPHLVSCCWRGSVTSGMLLMRLPSSSSRAVIRRVLIWRQLWMRYVDLVWTDDGRF